MAGLILLRDERPLVKFAVGDEATIGRSSECEVQLADTELSRRHATVRRHANGWELEDLGSRNGTRVDGTVVREAKVALREGAVIELGSNRLLFDPPIDVIGDRDGDNRVLLVPDEAAARGARRLPANLVRSAADLARDHARGLALIGDADRGGLGALLAALCEDVGAERACLVSTNREGALKPLSVHGSRSVTTSTTLLRRAMGERVALAVDDAQGDVSFASARSVLAYDLRSVVVTPLVHEGEVVGALHLDHSRRASFDDAMFARIAALAPAVALAVARTRPRPVTPAASPSIIGDDKKLRAAIDAAVRAGTAGTQLLVLGESGTGKELVARAYHVSAGRPGPWVAVNCAAFTETLLDSELFGHEQGAFTGASKRRRGCFEQADGGTLFLDEVGELGASTQAKLLRVLADRRFYRVGGEQPIDVDVRVVAATHRDLRARCAAGAFREDLFWRLAVITVEVPPLRVRGAADIAALTAHFFAQLGTELGRRPPTLVPEAQAIWDRYPWPGNVRELRNAVERLLVLHDGGVVEVDDLAPEQRAHQGRPVPGTLADAIARLEKEQIGAALSANNGNKSATARVLGISRPTLDRKLREYELGGDA
ncbi:MAG: sigma 54-interacting transcriptional regulator [Kofleriaceae bacterium]